MGNITVMSPSFMPSGRKRGEQTGLESEGGKAREACKRIIDKENT